jgi:hypothetical protein
MFAKYMEWHIPGWAVICIGLVSFGLLAYSAIVYLRLAWAWSHRLIGPHSSQVRDVLGRKLIPIMIGAAVLASFTLLAVSVGLGIMYRAGNFESKPPDIVINAPPPIPVPASAPTYGKLAANEPPDIPEEVAKRVARYLQLKDAIERAKAVRPALETSGVVYRDRMKPFKLGENRTIGFVDRWNYPLKELRNINDSIYRDRSLDLTSVPQLAIPTMVAPDEAAFPEDAGEARYRYRAFHFLLQNILKQADQLISDMEKEESLALQLPFMQVSESMGNHDSKIVDAASVD